MKIIIGVGFENIVFGMLQEEVVNIWGNPDRINKEDIVNYIVYFYNDRMTKLKFDEDENFKLISIDTYDPEITLFNQSIIGKTKDEIMKFLHDNGHSDIKYEEYDTFDTLYCEEIMITFEFEFNKLRGLEFSPLFKNPDERIWPIYNDLRQDKGVRLE